MGGVAEQDIWIYEFARGTMTRLTSAQTNLHPVWSGDDVIFDANLAYALGRQSIGGAQAAEIIAADESRHLTAVSLTPDGGQLMVEHSDDFFAFDIGVISLDGDGTVQPLLANPEFREMSPMLSPDGAWLAYVSDETGQNEVYVQPYPALDRRVLVSNGGGVEPVWSRDGTEIFYRTGFFGNVMMAVPFRATSGLEVGQPEQLFASPILAYASEPIGAHPVYDVAEDGRFLIAKRVSPPFEPRPMNVVTNWFQELTERVPVP